MKLAAAQSNRLYNLIYTTADAAVVAASDYYTYRTRYAPLSIVLCASFVRYEFYKTQHSLFLII